MFGKIAAFEFRYHFKSPIFWVASGIFALITFLSVAVDIFSVGDSGGGAHVNAPYAIAQTQLIFAILYMFVTTAFVASVVLRDDETGFGPILKTSRVSKFDYLYGRFVGAFAAVALSFTAIPLAQIIGAAMPWVDRETLGPFLPQAYAFAYFALALPALLLSSAIFFALATVTRSLMWTYLGMIALLVLWVVSGIATDRPEIEKVAALWEPFGAGAFGVATKYWTISERNTLIPELSGLLLWNRVIFIGLALGLLAATWFLFRFQTAAQSGKRSRRHRLIEAADPAQPAPPLRKLVKGVFDGRTSWTQLMARTRLDMGQVFRSPAYLVLLFLGLANALGSLWFATEVADYGGKVMPVTRLLIEPLFGAFGLIPVIIAAYYAGELVWRERDRQTHEIVDAAPVPDWMFVAPKTLAITLVLISTVLASVLLAIIVQLAKGYFDIEIGKYLLWYVLPLSLSMALLAVLAVFLQTVSPHKFVGWGLVLVVIIAVMSLPRAGFDHDLYIFGGGFLGPMIPLSDMNGQGRFWIGAWWVRLYWSAFAVMLLVLSYALWRRGTESRLLPRLRRLPRRISGKAGLIFAAALLLFAGSGGFIFYNTNILNEYRTSRDNEKWQADYEKALLRYERTPRPKIVSMKLDVDLYPDEPRAAVWGAYVVENRTGEPLKEIHVAFDRDLKVKALSIQGGRPKRTYERFNYRIFVLDTPMLPGERREITFTTERSQRGFRNSGNDTRIVGNGTFLNNAEFAPLLGMERGGLLQDRAKRRKYGLPSELRPPKLGDVPSRQFQYLRHDADFVTADITVSTVADQTPVAPGRIVSDKTSGSRRTVRFVTATPVLPFFSVQSARYEIARETYKGVDIAIYFDPRHRWNIERMTTGAKAALDYYQANFSPYQFDYLRFQEFPAYEDFAQAFAGTMPWSEGLFFIADYRDPSKIDMLTYVGAHEIGHQWWAHQVIGADQQGATALSETLAQYSALMVMKHLYGEDQIRKFLKFELNRYLSARGSEVVEELPLARVEGQGYIHYRKGALAMYRLQREIGEEAVNRALRKVLGDHAFNGAPYPISLDLIAALRAEAPAEKQALITDLFEKITLYDIQTRDVAVKTRADGRFDVTLTVTARKLYADGKGRETEAPMSERLDVGLFTAMPGEKGFDSSKVIAFETRPIRSGSQTLTFTVAKAPVYAGVDPYNYLIDRNSDDNVAKAD
ncbi:MAG: M1 family aminopeptidase [Pseudomonadota bacterium]